MKEQSHFTCISKHKKQARIRKEEKETEDSINLIEDYTQYYGRQQKKELTKEIDRKQKAITFMRQLLHLLNLKETN